MKAGTPTALHQAPASGADSQIWVDRLTSPASVIPPTRREQGHGPGKHQLREFMLISPRRYSQAHLRAQKKFGSMGQNVCSFSKYTISKQILNYSFLIDFLLVF